MDNLRSELQHLADIEFVFFIQKFYRMSIKNAHLNFNKPLKSDSSLISTYLKIYETSSVYNFV